jgi:hypothetical protein
MRDKEENIREGSLYKYEMWKSPFGYLIGNWDMDNGEKSS